MSHCPKDGLPCVDDLCHNGTCLRLPGVPMLKVCDGCGWLVTENDECGCEYDEPEPTP